MTYSKDEILKLETFNNSSTLFKGSIGNDNLYTFNRNCPGRLDVLTYIENMWNNFKHFSGDKDFITQFPNNFRQRWWELFLSNSFLSNGFELEATQAFGPDIKIKNVPTMYAIHDQTVKPISV